MRIAPSLSLLVALLLPGCATADLHHFTIDEIDASHGHLVPFELRASTIGINTEEAGRRASEISGNRQYKKAANTVELFQMGPHTGNTIYDERFADGLASQIRAYCPSGRVTGLVSERESATYDVVSDEYVTIRGFCIE
jgi:hypothetical protein